MGHAGNFCRPTKKTMSCTDCAQKSQLLAQYHHTKMQRKIIVPLVICIQVAFVQKQDGLLRDIFGDPGLECMQPKRSRRFHSYAIGGSSLSHTAPKKKLPRQFPTTMVNGPLWRVTCSAAVSGIRANGANVHYFGNEVGLQCDPTSQRKFLHCFDRFR